MSQPVHMRKGVNYSGNSFSATYADSVIGTILAYGGSTAPYGWFLCQGQALSRTEYYELFEVIGTAFGTGDGSTTFNIPDLRGEFLRGTGTNSHANQGNGGTVGQHQDATRHAVMSVGANLNDLRIGGTRAGQNWAKLATGADNDSIESGAAYYEAKISVSGSNTNDYRGYTARPTNTSVNFIIKAKYSASPAGDVLGVQDIRDTLGETPLPSSLATTVTGAIKEIDDCNHYSTSETWTGKYWNDGKKIYQRTFIVTNPTKDTYFAISGNVNVSNYDIKHYFGNVKTSEGFEFPVPMYFTETEKFLINKNNASIYCLIAEPRTVTEINLTIEYTKTT